MAKRYKTKYKSKRLGAADKALHKARMGDRPSMKNGLTDVLNWYNGTYEDPQQAYDAVMQYLIDSGGQKSVLKWTNNKSTILKYVNSHHWAIADLLNEGVDLPTDVVNRFRKRIKDIIAKEPDVPVAVPQVRTLTDVDRANKLIADLESEWDSMMELIRKKLKPKFSYKEFIADRNVTAEMQERVAEFYKTQHQELVDAYKDRIEGYETYSKGQLKVMIEILTDICSAKMAVNKPVAPAPKKSYYKPKPKKVTKTKGSRKKAVPPAFDKKAAAVIYYPQQKQVAVLFAEGGKKLEIKKKTVLNVDLNKSYVKRFGKQADMVTNLKKSKFDKVAQFVSTVSAAKLPATTRLRDGAIVVSMKD